MKKTEKNTIKILLPSTLFSRLRFARFSTIKSPMFERKFPIIQNGIIFIGILISLALSHTTVFCVLDPTANALISAFTGFNVDEALRLGINILANWGPHIISAIPPIWNFGVTTTGSIIVGGAASIAVIQLAEWGYNINYFMLKSGRQIPLVGGFLPKGEYKSFFIPIKKILGLPSTGQFQYDLAEHTVRYNPQQQLLLNNVISSDFTTTVITREVPRDIIVYKDRENLVDIRNDIQILSNKVSEFNILRKGIEGGEDSFVRELMHLDFLNTQEHIATFDFPFKHGVLKEIFIQTSTNLLDSTTTITNIKGFYKIVKGPWFTGAEEGLNVQELNVDLFNKEYPMISSIIKYKNGSLFTFSNSQDEEISVTNELANASITLDYREITGNLSNRALNRTLNPESFSFSGYSGQVTSDPYAYPNWNFEPNRLIQESLDVLRLLNENLDPMLSSSLTSLNSAVNTRLTTYETHSSSNPNEMDEQKTSDPIQEIQNLPTLDDAFNLVSNNPTLAIGGLLSAVFVHDHTSIEHVAHLLLGLSNYPTSNEIIMTCAQMSIEELKVTYNLTDVMADKAKASFEKMKELMNNNHGQTINNNANQFSSSSPISMKGLFYIGVATIVVGFIIHQTGILEVQTIKLFPELKR